MGWHIGGECPYCKKFLTDYDDDAMLIHGECFKTNKERRIEDL